MTGAMLWYIVLYNTITLGLDMIMRIDTTSSVPVYAQIIEQVKRAIAVGALKPGDSLGSLRETAVKLRVHPLTVSKAYKILEQEGLVESRQGSGSFIADGIAVPTEKFKRESISISLEKAMSDAVHLGLSGDELRALIEEKLRKFQF